MKVVTCSCAILETSLFDSKHALQRCIHDVYKMYICTHALPRRQPSPAVPSAWCPAPPQMCLAGTHEGFGEGTTIISFLFSYEPRMCWCDATYLPSYAVARAQTPPCLCHILCTCCTLAGTCTKASNKRRTTRRRRRGHSLFPAPGGPERPTRKVGFSVAVDPVTAGR